jgi:hypothetical protein
VTHLAISLGKAQWLSPVTDEEYAAKDKSKWSQVYYFPGLHIVQNGRLICRGTCRLVRPNDEEQEPSEDYAVRLHGLRLDGSKETVRVTSVAMAVGGQQLTLP